SPCETAFVDNVAPARGADPARESDERMSGTRVALPRETGGLTSLFADPRQHRGRRRRPVGRRPALAGAMQPLVMSLAVLLQRSPAGLASSTIQHFAK